MRSGYCSCGAGIEDGWLLVYDDISEICPDEAGSEMN